MPKISIIIPCFNQGQFLDESVNSVLQQTFQDFEIIIINDGSTDEYTNQLLKKYDKPKTKVIHTNNQGLPSARNNGIKASKGMYILPLDADDKIESTYLEKAVKVLDENPNMGIVYCDAEYFGDQSGRLNLLEYSYERILINNVIFCSALFPRQIWEKTGGYDSRMLYGLEDWDFWLSIIGQGFDVYKIPEVLFFYRIRKESMLKLLSDNKEFLFTMYMQAILNHSDMYLKNIPVFYQTLANFIQEYRISFLSSLFIDTGQSYNERAVVKQVITLNDHNEFTVAFDISRFKNIQSFRFDPFEGEWGKVKLSKVIYQTNEGETTEINPSQITSNGVLQDDGFHLFQTFDPFFYLNVSGAIKEVELTGELEILDNIKIEQIVQQKDDIIKTILEENNGIRKLSKKLIKTLLENKMPWLLKAYRKI